MSQLFLRKDFRRHVFFERRRSVGAQGSREKTEGFALETVLIIPVLSRYAWISLLEHILCVGLHGLGLVVGYLASQFVFVF